MSDAETASRSPMDPYQKWGALTGFADFSDFENDEGYVALLVELPSEVTWSTLTQPWASDPRWKYLVLARPDKSLEDAEFLALYAPAWIVKGHWDELAALFKRLKLGWAIKTHDPQGLIEPERLKGRVVVAVIDGEIAYDHPTFRKLPNANIESRFRFFWDQNPIPDGHEVGHGRRYTYGVERAYLANYLGSVVPVMVPSNVMAASTHGTHVASLLAGLEPPAYRLRHDEKLAIGTPADRDHVSELDVVGIRLPGKTVADTSCASLAPHVIDALHYIVWRCASTTQIVANLSFGRLTGPHDGSSMLERAIDDILLRCKGRFSLVLPTGNSFSLQHHAVLTDARIAQTLTWRIPPDNPVPVFIEIWAEQDAELSVKLKDPRGRELSTTSDGATVSGYNGTSTTAVIGAVIPCANPVDSNSGKKLVLLVVAPTAPIDVRRAAAQAGDWEVQIKNKVQGAVRIWIERDDVHAGNTPIARRSFFVEAGKARGDVAGTYPASLSACAITGHGTINGLATGSLPIAVGGYRLSDAAGADYSGSGSGEHSIKGPAGVAPSEQSLLLKGIPGAAASPSGVTRYWGTSVAAPIYARWHANSLVAPATYGNERKAIITLTEVIRSRLGDWRLDLPVTNDEAVPSPTKSFGYEVAGSRPLADPSSTD